MKGKNSNKQIASALYEVTRGLKGEKLTKALHSFVAFLVRARKIKQKDKIINEFISYAKKQEGIKEIEITAARGLDDGTVKQIKKCFGNNVEEKIVIDKEILGGIKIKTDDKILDASLKTQLNNLKNTLAN